MDYKRKYLKYKYKYLKKRIVNPEIGKKVIRNNINNMKGGDIIELGRGVHGIVYYDTENPDVIIKTEFGIGKYKFIKFNELQGNLVLEFQLLEDNHFKDTNSINTNIGNTCFLSIHQYLYVYSSACA